MDSRSMRMDSEFDKHLVDMKPYLLNLPHKTERQRCALWIKKLCEPVGSSTARKNRNMHSKLLLHMLKRGVVDGPFATRPESGPLKTLPSYMSIFFDEPFTTGARHKRLDNDNSSEDDFKLTSTPDWAKGELPFSSSEKFPGTNESFNTVDAHRLQARQNEETDFRGTKFSSLPSHKATEFRASHSGTSAFRDEQSLINMHEKELEMKTKLLEAGFHEEKLNLQHKHDLAVQKILDRKNSEIEELKRHYKSKEKEHEEIKRKMEKKVQSAMKEAHVVKECKDKQIEDLNSLVDETTESLRAEYEAKIHDLMGNVEREKYELQKCHTKNIQDLLDDTNKRLTSMEDEYNSQQQATKVVVSELEHHVSQLTQEAESMATSKQNLFIEKQQLEMEQARLMSDAKQASNKCEELQEDVASLREERDNAIHNLHNKHEANVEFMRQEQAIAASRAQENIRDLEDQIQNLKHALQDSEQQRSRETREKESLHQQDAMSMQHLHEKKMHSLRAEWDQENAQHGRAVKALEDVIKEKDDQIVKLTVALKQCSVQAEQAIEAYKKQVSDAQQKVYSDMRSQLEKMEGDLEQSKMTRDKLQEEFKKQFEEAKDQHNDELAETRVMYEHDKGVMTQRFASDRDKLVRDYEAQLSSGESRLRDALEQQEKIAEERRMQHQEVVSALELQIRELREELVSANALRRQQLVELGLLREEERQKASRDHDMAVARVESEIDRQRMELHQQHAAELDRQAQKMKSKFEQLENDYRQRLDRAHERMLDAQNKEAGMREMMIQNKNDSEEDLLQNVAKMEDEHQQMKMQHNTLILNLQSELEKERGECHVTQRRSQQVEFELKNELSRVKMECEERMKGLLPKALKMDLEETISCLRSQVKTLQQRVEVLQDEVESDRARSMATTPSLRM